MNVVNEPAVTDVSLWICVYSKSYVVTSAFNKDPLFLLTVENGVSSSEKVSVAVGYETHLS